jgi:hypothetical protein
MTRSTATFSASSTTARSITLAMALTVTLGLLGSMGHIAHHEVRSAETQLASAQPAQVVVIIGQRSARV